MLYCGVLPQSRLDLGGLRQAFLGPNVCVWVCIFVSVTGGQPFIQRRDAFCVWVDAAVELRLAIHVAKMGLRRLRQYKCCEWLLINLLRSV